MNSLKKFVKEGIEPIENTIMKISGVESELSMPVNVPIQFSLQAPDSNSELPEISDGRDFSTSNSAGSLTNIKLSASVNV